MGGSDKLERFLDELEAEAIDPKDYVDAEDFFADLRATVKQRLDTPRG